jgi:acyl-CoA reductase-like NAD-dependent aldehyde dehydrogenase
MAATTSAGADTTVGLFIDGRWCLGDRRFERRNPARPQEVVGCSTAAGAAEVDAAYQAAERGARTWARTPAPHRAEVLMRAAALVAERVAEIARTLTLEEGKACRDARGEVLRAATILRFHAGEGTQPVGEVFASAAPGTMIHTVREPVGPIAVITPWNFPIAIPAWKIAPALAYGNSVVWKPAEIASGTAAMLVECLDDAGLPAGVLNLVTGHGREIGDALVDDPRARAVTFTGSNAVGRGIAQRAAARGVKAQLELGGKNPSVVLGDADLERAAGCITRSAMLSAGQRCTATSRVIVVDALHDEVVERLVSASDALVVGDPLDAATDIGPVASSSQFDTVSSYLDVAAAEGLRCLRGGQTGPPDDGYFVPPTIYADVDPASRIAREEIFGPVIAVLRARDADHAFALANDTEYGLSASVFTTDFATALRATRELEAGVVHVNGESAGAEPHVPFGGMKASSSGSREQGKAAAEFFTETKTVYLEDL